MALGLSGRWQALRQFHLQLSHSSIFIPSILLMRILALSAQLGLSFLLLGTQTSPPDKVNRKSTQFNYLASMRIVVRFLFLSF